MHTNKSESRVDLSNRELGPVAYGEAGWTLSRGLEAERQRAQGE